MTELTTISKNAPSSTAQDFELLRKEALAYIQKLSGKVWTDYNTHDPGVTILEVLCYAITDLSYRANRPIQDLLADPNGSLAKQFFTASEILPSRALTLADYRKLLIDVEIVGDVGDPAPFAGIKNAWLELRKSNEIPIYPDRKEKKLAYKPFPVSEEALQLGILYDVLLEFDTTEGLGDLNENKLSMEISIDEHISLSGVVVDIQVEFPRWDAAIDWSDRSAIRKAIQSINIQFQNLEDEFEINISLTPSNYIKLDGTELTPSGLEEIEDLQTITDLVNDFAFKDDDGVLSFYLLKIAKIREILVQTKSTLLSNRNLCEDFVEFHALRVEEIVICADIELDQEADVELTEAQIFASIADFLSPQVNFYSLDEMLNRCKSDGLPITRIQQNPAKVWIEIDEDLYPKAGSQLSITGSGNNAGTYEILEVNTFAQDQKLAEIKLSPNFTSPILREGDEAYFGNWEEEQCAPTEEIFEGPLLKHGFIDDEELKKADRKASIHVSDLIHIIMDIEGVLAVKSIQIANLPQDDADNEIPSKSVRWCLKLALEENYVPRLNDSLSKLTYYKEGIPFRANREEMEDLLAQIQAEKRPQKLRYPKRDFDQILGQFTNSSEYFSIQNDFPIVYGIGEEGMLSQSDGRPKPHQTAQLKAYLIVFEQFLANYLSQLAHVKDLFSISAEKDQFGNSLISNTYFSQSLEEIVPNSQALWKDLAGLKEILSEITESKEAYLDRRIRFLSHLLARFAEQLTDYSLLSLRLQGENAKEELIKDKLDFLANYPITSAARGLGYDYSLAEMFYHVDNLSGIEKRLSGLYGIKSKPESWLIFRPHFVFTESAETWEISVLDELEQAIFELSKSFKSKDEAALDLEKYLLIGAELSNWVIVEESGARYVALIFGEEVLGLSSETNFVDLASANEAREKLQALFLDEFLENPRANRKNLSLGLEHWFDYNITTSMAPAPPSYGVEFQFFNAPFDQGQAILTGKVEAEIPDAVNETELEDLATEAIQDHIWRMVAAGSGLSGYGLDADNSEPYKLSIIDPVREEILARSIDSNFNEILASQLLDGIWGDCWLDQESFPPLLLALSSSEAQGSKIKLQADQIPAIGDLIHFIKALEIVELDVATHSIKVAGNHSVILNEGDEFVVNIDIDGEISTVTYSVFSIQFDAGKTEIITKELPRADLLERDVEVIRSFEVVDILPDSFLISGGEEKKAIEALQNFFQSQFFSHEGTHLFEHILLRPKHQGNYKFDDGSGSLVTETIVDRLMDPHFQEECQCTLDDPYTCMGHVILPYWPGRFPNRDFRNFLENKIKLEAPAHVFLTICWISPAHMDGLEKAWKLWQIESLKAEKHPKNLSTALSQLIDELEKVRNVYPSGSLHDCEEGDSLAEAIILNYSSLGEF